MKRLRWLPASMLALVLFSQGAWSQNTAIILQGLPLVPGPQAAQSEKVVARQAALPQVDLVSEGRDPEEVNQARQAAAVAEEEEDLQPASVAECLRFWGLHWREGNYQQAQMYAEKAVLLEPRNVAAQHACALCQIVNQLGKKACSEPVCPAEPACCVDACECVAGMLCLPPPCMDFLSFLKPMMCRGAKSKVVVLDPDCDGEYKDILVQIKETHQGSCLDCPAAAAKSAKDCCDSSCASAKPGKCGEFAQVPCCKPGACTCCGKCPCKVASKTKSAKATLVFPQLMKNFQGMMHPPVVITGFGPFTPPPMGQAWVVPPPPGMPPPWGQPQFRVVSRPGEEAGQSAFQINATGNQVHITTPHLDAHCQRMTCLGTRDRVLLEGNVRIACRKGDQVTRIEAARVLVDLLHGTFTVETGTGPAPARPGAVGGTNGPGEQGFYQIRPTGYSPLPYSER